MIQISDGVSFKISLGVHYFSKSTGLFVWLSACRVSESEQNFQGWYPLDEESFRLKKTRIGLAVQAYGANQTKIVKLTDWMSK